MNSVQASDWNSPPAPAQPSAGITLAANLLVVSCLLILWPSLVVALFGAAIVLVVFDAGRGGRDWVFSRAKRLVRTLLGQRDVSAVADLAKPVVEQSNVCDRSAGPRPMVFVLPQAALFEPDSAVLKPVGRVTLGEMAQNVVVPLTRADVIARACVPANREDTAQAAALAAQRAQAVADILRAERLAPTIGVFGAHVRGGPGQISGAGTIELMLRRSDDGLRDVA